MTNVLTQQWSNFLHLLDGVLSKIASESQWEEQKLTSIAGVNLLLSKVIEYGEYAIW